MSRATMLRTRRKDVNIKPNRRLDRKSSRGMIYENEELRLRTININAEVEKGQSDIKKLRRENEQLRREIWFIRNEYEKLENKLLQSGAGKSDGSEESSTTCSSEEDSEDSSCHSCADVTEEANQNFENGEKVDRSNMHVQFDHLSVVSEENSLEKSSDSPEQNNTNVIACKTNSILGPDQSYPETNALNRSTENFPRNFFAPLPIRKRENDNAAIYEKTSPDVCVNEATLTEIGADRSSFQSGGNLDQLLQDMDNISKDILQYSTSIKSVHDVCGTKNLNPFTTTSQTDHPEICNSFIQIDSNITPESSPLMNETEPNFLVGQKPYKSEINVVLVPNPMPLIGFEKYKLTQKSNPDISITSQQFMEKLNLDTKTIEPPSHSFEFHSQTFPQFQQQVSFNSNSTIDTSRNFNVRSGNTTPIPPVPDPYQTSSTILPKLCQFCQVPLIIDSQNNMNCQTCVPYNFNTPPNQLSGFNFDVPPYQTSTLLKTSQENVSGVTESHNKKHIPNVLEIPPVQIHTPEEINSPKIIKENFPSENEADAHPKNIDDTNLDKTSSSDDKPPKPTQTNDINKGGKIRKHRKLSIHFNGSKKLSRSVSLETNTTSSATNSKHLDTPLPLLNDPLKTLKPNEQDRDSVTPTPNANPKKSPNFERKMSLTSNTSSIDKKHVKIEGTKTEKKHKHDGKKRRKNSITEKLSKNRRESIDLPRSSKHESWLHNRQYDSFNEFTSLSERERTNSLTSESSRNTTKSRKLSEYSTLNNAGKVPWCGCWGNGCL